MWEEARVTAWGKENALCVMNCKKQTYESELHHEENGNKDH